MTLFDYWILFLPVWEGAFANQLGTYQGVQGFVKTVIAKERPCQQCDGRKQGSAYAAEYVAIDIRKQ